MEPYGIFHIDHFLRSFIKIHHPAFKSVQREAGEIVRARWLGGEVTSHHWQPEFNSWELPIAENCGVFKFQLSCSQFKSVSLCGLGYLKLFSFPSF